MTQHRYGYTKHAEQCAHCDEQVSAALRFYEIREEPPEVLELECGHIWHRTIVPESTDWTRDADIPALSDDVGKSQQNEWLALRDLVNEQADDAGLWFGAKAASEAYLQQELRRLHAAVEAAIPGMFERDRG